MKRRNPDHRLRAVCEANSPPEHMLEAALWNLRHGVEPIDPNVAWAYDIYMEMTEREILQAFLLAGASDDDVHEILKVPTSVTQAYRYLFFDPSAFRDELHLLTWVRKYEEARVGTQHGAQLLRKALMAGVNGLRWVYGRGGAAPDPVDVQRQVMTDAYFRGQSHRMYEIGSAEAKAALSLMNTALKVATTLSKKVDTSGINALAIRLRHREMTTTVEETEDVPLH